MRVRNGSIQLLESAQIPAAHAIILQGQQTRLTGFSTDRMVECEFSYRILGAGFQPHDTFTYLIPYQALEARV
jgi:hypothetical protein